MLVGIMAFGAGSMMFAGEFLGADGRGRAATSSADVSELVSTEVRAQLLQEFMRMRGDGKSTVTGASGMQYPPVADIRDRDRKRILVTGGAGFVGSNLVDKLMMEGHEVTVLDNMFTGRRKNVEHWLGHPNFALVVADVVDSVHLEVDQIYHLACPASPPHYQYNPIKTIKTSTEGTLNMLGLAKRVQARILLTSTSEIYGDPEISPQVETYWVRPPPRSRPLPPAAQKPPPHLTPPPRATSTPSALARVTTRASASRRR